MAKQYTDQAYLEKIGRKIAQIRDVQKLSQEKLAGMAGMDTRQLGRIERAENNSSVSVIKKIADALGVEPGDILDV